MSNIAAGNINQMACGEPAPLVSVVIPVYNAQEFLEACLDSVLSQSYPNLELILVDDGSPDKSGEICDAYALKDTRVRVIHQQNSGVSAARTMERFGVDLVLSGFERFKGGWVQRSRLNPFYTVVLQSRKELAQLYTRANTNMFGVSIWAKLYRKDVIQKNHIRFDINVNYEEDCLFNLDYFRCIETAAAVPNCFYRYRQQEMSLSKGYRQDGFAFLINGYKARKAFLTEQELSLSGAKGIFLIVVKNTLLKVYHSGLSFAEKKEQYHWIMEQEESQEAAGFMVESQGRLNRVLSKIILKNNAMMVHCCLMAWEKLSPLKKKIKRLLGR